MPIGLSEVPAQLENQLVLGFPLFSLCQQEAAESKSGPKNVCLFVGTRAM